MFEYILQIKNNYGCAMIHVYHNEKFNKDRMAAMLGDVYESLSEEKPGIPRNLLGIYVIEELKNKFNFTSIKETEIYDFNHSKIISRRELIS